MNILITGPSGSGKSVLAKYLRDQGFEAIDADIDKFNGTSIAYWRNMSTGKGEYMPSPPPKEWSRDHDWIWRIGVLEANLAASSKSTVFVCGDARNRDEAYPLFDRIFILKADDKTLYERIQARKDNHFGKSPSEYAWIAEQNKTLSDTATAGAVIDANQSLDKVIADILEKLT